MYNTYTFLFIQRASPQGEGSGVTGEKTTALELPREASRRLISIMEISPHQKDTTRCNSNFYKTDTSVMRTLGSVPSVSVLEGITVSHAGNSAIFNVT